MKFRPQGFSNLLVAKHHKCNKNEVGKVWWQNQVILVDFRGLARWHG